MLKLGAAPSGWLDLLPGVRARFDAIDRPMIRAARRAASAFIVDHPDMEAEDRKEGAGDAFTAELIRLGLREWEGIGDPAGQPLAVDAPGAVDQFLAEPLLFEAADQAWIVPWAAQAAEKNVSSPSPAGTSVTATGARTTAGSAAKRAKKAGKAATGAKPGAAAKNAPTASTSRAPTRAKRSGK